MVPVTTRRLGVTALVLLACVSEVQALKKDASAALEQPKENLALTLEEVVDEDSAEEKPSSRGTEHKAASPHKVSVHPVKKNPAHSVARSPPKNAFRQTKTARNSTVWNSTDENSTGSNADVNTTNALAPKSKSSLAPESEVVAENTTATKTMQCSDADASTMLKMGGGHKVGSFPRTSAKCGKKAYHIFGGFKVADFLSCMGQRTGISETCAACFAGAAEHGVHHCAVQCMFSWCSLGCLSCTEEYRKTDLTTCVGFVSPEPEKC